VRPAALVVELLFGADEIVVENGLHRFGRVEPYSAPLDREVLVEQHSGAMQLDGVKRGFPIPEPLRTGPH